MAVTRSHSLWTDRAQRFRLRRLLVKQGAPVVGLRTSPLLAHRVILYNILQVTAHPRKCRTRVHHAPPWDVAFLSHVHSGGGLPQEKPSRSPFSCPASCAAEHTLIRFYDNGPAVRIAFKSGVRLGQMSSSNREGY